MQGSKVQKLALAGMLCAIAVIGSSFSFPVLGSRCAPVQHTVNILSAILLGPYYGLLVAFVASFLRNIFGLGSLLAFPGSMFGVFIAGLVYQRTKKILPTCIGECFGTGILGGLCAYPIAVLFMGKAGHIGYFVYIIPFLISTMGGSLIGGIIAFWLKKTKRLPKEV